MPFASKRQHDYLALLMSKMGRRPKTTPCHCCDGSGIERPLDFGAKLRSRRLALGISQKEMAIALDISPSMLVFLEKDKRRWLTLYAELYELELAKAERGTDE